jgi:hypothetical protein
MTICILLSAIQLSYLCGVAVSAVVKSGFFAGVTVGFLFISQGAGIPCAQKCNNGFTEQVLTVSGFKIRFNFIRRTTPDDFTAFGDITIRQDAGQSLYPIVLVTLPIIPATFSNSK